MSQSNLSTLLTPAYPHTPDPGQASPPRVTPVTPPACPPARPPLLPGHILLAGGEDLSDALAGNPPNLNPVFELEPEQLYNVTAPIPVGVGNVTIKLSGLADRKEGSKPALIEVDTDASFAAVAAGGNLSPTPNLNPNPNPNLNPNPNPNPNQAASRLSE